MSSSSSLVFSSLALPKTISHPKSTLSFVSSASSLKLNAARVASLFIAAAPSRLVTSVAVSSEFQQDEDVLSGGEEPNFSPDLKLFVGNLPFNVDSSDLAALFERAGNVEMVEVIYDKLTGRSRGFGFVTMSSVQEVEAAAQQFNGYELEGRPLRVNAGPPPPKRDDSGFGGARGAPRFDSGNSGFRGGRSGSFDAANRLYVGNLSWGVDNAALENLFSEQGKVVEARVVYDRDTGRSRGFGFVTYSSADEANSAVETLNGVDLNGRSIRVTVAESKPRPF
ncbi:hypothetical protein QQ045_003901 [Rhodiola kirilowii]